MQPLYPKQTSKQTNENNSAWLIHALHFSNEMIRHIKTFIDNGAMIKKANSLRSCFRSTVKKTNVESWFVQMPPHSLLPFFPLWQYILFICLKLLKDPLSFSGKKAGVIKAICFCINHAVLDDKWLSECHMQLFIIA